MDSVFFYRLIEAVRRSFEAAGHSGLVLSWGGDPAQWFDLDILFEYLERIDPEQVPFLWEGKPLPEFSTLQVSREVSGARVYRSARNGIVLVRDEVAIAILDAVGSDGYESSYLVAGERRPGSLERFLKEYDREARRVARERPWITVIGGKPLERPRGVTWEDVILPTETRDDFRTQIEGFFSSREAYRHLKIPYRRGILLAGPPGNGKTTLLRVVASQFTEPMILFQRAADDRRDRLDEAFEKAYSAAPAILCFEDVDSLFREEGMLSHFLNRLDGLAPTEGVLVLATTNHPEELDEALTERPSRFDRVYWLGNPGPDERRRFLKSHFGPSYDERLVRWTDGFSFAQIREVWISAGLAAIGSGRPGPTLEEARRAARRLRGQTEVRQREWRVAGRVGFRPSVSSEGEAAPGRNEAPPGALFQERGLSRRGDPRAEGSPRGVP